MNLTQPEIIHSIIENTPFNSGDVACIDQAKEKFQEWRNEIVTSLMQYIQNDTNLQTHLNEKAISMQTVESNLFEWYDRIINDTHDDDFWNNIWLFGLKTLQLDIEISYIITFGYRFVFELQQRIFSTYREGSALKLSNAISNIISCTISIVSESAYYERFACSEQAGLTKPIIQRLINVEVNSRT